MLLIAKPICILRQSYFWHKIIVMEKVNASVHVAVFVVADVAVAAAAHVAVVVVAASGKLT